ncbi:MAG: multiheme c-type cytochrome [Gemmatimonadaceae bacterium]
MSARPALAAFLSLLVTLTPLSFVALTACGGGSAEAFAGSASCAGCHREAYNGWRASQHAAAMLPANDSTVRGDFRDRSFTEDGTTSRFFRRNGKFVANTVGPDGALHDYDVAYTFGVFPLQQYLVPFPGGRLQPLPLAWDTRPSAQGGQRWFTLDHVAPLGAEDDGHWSGRGLNWNYMCADCHATAVRKRYEPAADTFATAFVEPGVGCESCHGPGAAHVAWGRWPAWLRATLRRDDGLRARLNERAGIQWRVDATRQQPVRSAPRRTSREIETCAPCHARRVHLADGWAAGKALLDFYDPEVLVPGLYYADGQQRDEVYDHASFLQSRMFAAGVTCADCHDPHTQKLRAPGRLVCQQCHAAARYDTSAHHGHARDREGSDCAACHMPVTTYLEIDGRHDHSIRIPRPDRTVALGVPNACATCHADKPAMWAASAVARWRGNGVPGNQPFAESFAAAERGDAGARERLLAVAGDSGESAIARASAWARLQGTGDPAVHAAAARALRDPEPLVRRWAIEAVGDAPDSVRMLLLVPALSDARRAVRQRAAWYLAPLASRLPAGASRHAFDSAAAEFVASQRYNADRADHRVALGVFFLARGDTSAALVEFRTAARQWPRHLDAVRNLAGVLSLQGRERDGEAALRDAIARVPDVAGLHDALAQSLARQQRLAEAIAESERAVQLSEGDATFRRTLAALRNAAPQHR